MMTEKTLDDVKKLILQLFTKYPKQFFKLQEISRRLSLDNDGEQRLLLKALHELSSTQLIARARRKRYGYATPLHSQRLQGTLYLTKAGTGIITLLPPAEGKAIVQPKFMSNALDGDTVEIVLFAHPSKQSDPNNPLSYPECEIVAVVERSKKPLVGTFQENRNYFFVVPDENRIGRDIYIFKGKTMGARPGSGHAKATGSVPSNPLPAKYPPTEIGRAHV